MPRFSKERKTEIDAAVKERIVKAVSSILLRTRSAKITIAMLAEESGIPKSTLYDRFENKDEIVAYVIEKCCEPLGEIDTRIFDSDMGVVDKLRAMTEERLRTDYLWTRVVQIGNNISGSDITQPVLELGLRRQRNMAALKGVLRQGVRQGLFRDMALRYLAIAFVGVRQGEHLRCGHLQQNGERSTAKDAARVMKTFMEGTALKRCRVKPSAVERREIHMEDTIMGRVVRSVIELIRGADADRFSLASISMNAIADRMGVPKPFLYKHFSNKDGLMAFVWEAMFEPRKKIITEVVNGGAAVPEKLMGLAATGMNKSEEMNRMLFASGDREEMPLLYMAICDSERFFSEALLAVMEKGIHEGLFREMTASEIAACFDGLIVACVGYNTYYGKGKSIEKDVAALVDVFLNGVARRRNDCHERFQFDRR